ncbi:MAG: tryptophan--tRNA ligase, partial [Rhodoferax sp.]|nr:tryptophan--tRNA ligase [Rhodoferax sp.]
VIALFGAREQVRKSIFSIVTDSRAPGEPKQVEGSALFQIYQAFATPAETEALRKAYADGIAWGDAKQMLFERIDAEVAPMRSTYQALIDNPGKIEDILLAGAVKARKLATPLMGELRRAVGLRDLRTQAKGKTAKAAKLALPSFKQYRETDGSFRFKFVDAQGRLLLQSAAFASPKDAGQAIAGLQRDGAAALQGLQAQLENVDGVGADEVTAALSLLASASA